MHRKLLLLSAVLLSSLLSSVGAKAQGNDAPKANKVATLNPRFFDKLTFLVGPGMAVVNSDNRARNYRGDVGFLRGNGFGPAVSVGAAYPLSAYVGITGNLEYMRLKGKQDTGENALAGSFDFRSSVVSASAAAMVNLASRRALSRFNGSRTPGHLPALPYVRAGLGLLRYKASSAAERDRSGMAATLPVSAGLRLKYSDQLSFAPEITFHATTTDRIDNRGRAWGLTGNMDKLFSASVKLLYTPSRANARR